MILNNSERALSIIEACLSQGEVRFQVDERSTNESATIASNLARAGVLYLKHRKAQEHNVTVVYELTPTFSHWLQREKAR